MLFFINCFKCVVRGVPYNGYEGIVFARIVLYTWNKVILGIYNLQFVLF